MVANEAAGQPRSKRCDHASRRSARRRPAHIDEPTRSRRAATAGRGPCRRQGDFVAHAAIPRLSSAMAENKAMALLIPDVYRAELCSTASAALSTPASATLSWNKSPCLPSASTLWPAPSRPSRPRASKPMPAGAQRVRRRTVRTPADAPVTTTILPRRPCAVGDAYEAGPRRHGPHHRRIDAAKLKQSQADLLDARCGQARNASAKAMSNSAPNILAGYRGFQTTSSMGS